MSNASVAMLRRALMVAVIGVGIGSTLAATSRDAAPAQAPAAPAAAVSTAAAKGTAMQASATFDIPSQDSYGVDACLSSGGACGATVANAWCEAHGFAQAVSYGPSAEPQSVRVDCRA